MSDKYSEEFQIYCYAVRSCLAQNFGLDQECIGIIMAELDDQLRQMHLRGVSTGKAVVLVSDYARRKKASVGFGS